MRKRHAHAANLETQRNVHWSLHACTRVMSYTIAPAYTKLASSAARTVLPTTIQLITPHTMRAPNALPWSALLHPRIAT